MLICGECGSEIDSKRIEIFREFRGHDPSKCTQCSTEAKKVSRMIYSHKTAGEIVSVSGDDPEAVRMLDRAWKRKR